MPSGFQCCAAEEGGRMLNLSIDIGSPSHWNPLVSVSIRHLNWPIALGHLLWGTYQASHALSCTCQFIQKALKKTAWNIIKESSNECIERLVPPIDTVRRSLCEASLTLPFGLIFLLLHSIPKLQECLVYGYGTSRWHPWSYGSEKRRPLGWGRLPQSLCWAMLLTLPFNSFAFLLLIDPMVRTRTRKPRREIDPT